MNSGCYTPQAVINRSMKMRIKLCGALVALLYVLDHAVFGRNVFKPNVKPDDEEDLLVPIFPHEWPPDQIASKLKDDDVIPDVFNVSPKYVLNVTYSPGVNVYFGNELAPVEVKQEPQLCTWPVVDGHNYTLIMTGADDPSVANHYNREFLQWLVVDIPGCDVLKGNIIANYVPIKMPPETGLHRFVFTAYMQPKWRPKWHESPIHKNDEKRRVKFSNGKFAKEYNLGDVYAANYFISEPESK